MLGYSSAFERDVVALAPQNHQPRIGKGRLARLGDRPRSARYQQSRRFDAHNFRLGIPLGFLEGPSWSSSKARALTKRSMAPRSEPTPRSEPRLTEGNRVLVELSLSQRC